MGLGLWDNMPQSDNPLKVAEHVVQSICAADHDVPLDKVKVIGWFDIPEDHPDREFGVQAVDVEYIPNSTPPKYPYDKARALYGITEHGKLILWAN